MEGEEIKPAGAPSTKVWLVVIVVLVAVIVVLAAILAAPILIPEEPAPKIGTVIPQTGLLEIFGPTAVISANMAVADINDAGGVLGRNLVIVHEDTATASATGVVAARKLVDVDGVQAIVGAFASAVSRPVMESVALPSRIVQVSPASTSPIFTDAMMGQDAGDRFFFRTAPSDALQGPVGAQYAYDELGWRNVGVMHLDDPYGAGLAGSFEARFAELGGTIGASVAYNPEAVSFSSELTTVFDADPDGIYIVAFPGEGEILFGDWWENPDWRDIEWLGTDGITSQTFITTLLEQDIDVRGILHGTNPIASLAVEDVTADFNARFEEATLGLRTPETFDDNTYDAVFVIALAMQAGGSARSESIRANLHRVANPPGEEIGIGPTNWTRAVELLAAGQEINFEGASGSVNFDEFGDVGSDYEIWTVNEDGEMVRVTRIQEADIQTSPPAPGVSSALAAAAGIFLPEASVARE